MVLWPLSARIVATWGAERPIRAVPYEPPRPDRSPIWAQEPARSPLNAPVSAERYEAADRRKRLFVHRRPLHEPLRCRRGILDQRAHVVGRLAEAAEHVPRDDLRVGRVRPPHPHPNAPEVRPAE